MSPSQELFDRLYYYSQNELNYDTYNQLPRLDAKYPFIEFGEAFSTSNDLKHDSAGQVSQTINFWGSEDMRFDISNMMDKFNFYHLKTDHYAFTRNQGQTQNRIMPDSSVENTRLYHGVLTLVFNYLQIRKD